MGNKRNRSQLAQIASMGHARNYTGGTAQPKAAQPKPVDDAKPKYRRSELVADPQSAVRYGAEISDEDLAITVRVLQVLGKKPDLFRSPRFKALRAVVYPVVQAPAGGQAARASDALSDGRWDDAILAFESLAAMKDVPKLGSVQRWVRDMDLAGTNSEEAWRAMDAMLRAAAPEQVPPQPTPSDVLARSSGVVVAFQDWAPVPLQTNAAVVTADVDAIKAKFSVLLREPAAQRRPPNQFDMVLYQAEAGAVPLRPLKDVVCTRMDCPFLPLTCYLDGLLSPEECAMFLATAEGIGFLSDVPLTNLVNSVTAHHFVWMADDSFIGELFRRCKPHLPQHLCGGTLHSLNGRLRCYRYTPGSTYRPHVDGAWPQSTVDEDGKYIYDSSRRIWSRLTFLIYLNEDFDGGWTSFYTPAKEHGKLLQHRVVPRVGGAMVFPHGDTTGCLIHEGSGVTKGAKYIIRTEVLYEHPEHIQGPTTATPTLANTKK